MSDLEGGFVSTWRKMHEWEWYDDDAVFKIFIGFLWLANYKDQQWKGITIKRGSFITSTAKLCNYFNKSKNTILNEQNTREYRLLYEKNINSGEKGTKKTPSSVTLSSEAYFEKQSMQVPQLM